MNENILVDHQAFAFANGANIAAENLIKLHGSQGIMVDNYPPETRGQSARVKHGYLP